MARSTWGHAGCASRPRWQGLFCLQSLPSASPPQSEACLPCLPCPARVLGAAANPGPACTPEEAAVPRAAGCGLGRGPGQQVGPTGPGSVRPSCSVLLRPGQHFGDPGRGCRAAQEAVLVSAPASRGFPPAALTHGLRASPVPAPDPVLLPQCWPLPGAAEQGQCPGPLQPPRWGNSGALYQEKGLGLREGGFASPLCALGDEAMPRGCCTASSQWLVWISPKPRS